MSILINSETKVIVQGITGHHGSFHTERMLKYGTKVIAGVTPGKGGQRVHGLTVFESVKQAQEQENADFSIIFVPAAFALDAAMESLSENLNLVLITEGIPVFDAMKISLEARKRDLIVIGPNCPGIITPGECKIGIMPGQFFKKGKVGVLSRSGTLTYQISKNLLDAGMGQSTVIGIGGDMVNGFGFIEGLERMEKDPETEVIVLIGEIGGDAEERAAEYIMENVTKPVVAYIAGRTAPEGKTMGHAGAIISGGTGTFNTKIEALKNAGVKVAELPSEVAGLI
jgi:succinyl-CoA synthetase alpha subunit